MSSGGLAPQQPPVTNLVPFFTENPNNSTPNFDNIFSKNNNFSLQHILAAAVNSQRAKLKRCRQRVDAGEPRNSYQVNDSSLIFLILHFTESNENERIQERTICFCS